MLDELKLNFKVPFLGHLDCVCPFYFDASSFKPTVQIKHPISKKPEKSRLSKYMINMQLIVKFVIKFLQRPNALY